MATQPEDGPRLLGVVATIVGLTAFVVAQPLLALLGDGATFFVAHGATAGDVLAFTAAVVLVPPTLVGGALLVAYGAAPARFPLVLAATVGVLVAAFVVPAVDRAVGLPVPAFVALALVVAVGAAVLHRRVAVARTYAAATGFAPLLFAGLFLLASPVSSIVLPADAAAGASAAQQTDVVVLVFDELPLVALLDEHGEIDAVRYPNLARLADTSTWYASTTTVAPSTTLAVPALLAGVETSDRRTLPVAAEYPRNLMTMLADTHEVHSMEAITYLCGPTCESDRVRSRRALVRDASTLYLHSLLPDGLADRWLPETGSQWAGFAGSADDDLREDIAAEVGLDQSNRAERLVELLAAPSAGPRLVVGHLLLPHTPYTYLPDGRTYQPPQTPHGLVGTGEWGTEESVEVARQLSLLQTRYVDTVVGQALDALERRGTLDDTLLVVAADHGMVLLPGENRRGPELTEENLTELAVVPLLVHYPGQTTPEVDRQPRQITDVLPTVADVLGVDLDDAWRLDGVSLLDPDPREERTYAGETEVALPLEPDLSPALARYSRLFGSGRPEHDVYAWGPHRELVGERVDPHRSADDRPGPSATIAAEGLAEVDLGRRALPALVEVTFVDRPDVEWVAVSLDGTVAGLGLVDVVSGTALSRVVVDPALVGPTNLVEVWAVTDDGLVPLAPAG